jgi:hypothetical protein
MWRILEAEIMKCQRCRKTLSFIEILCSLNAFIPYQYCKKCDEEMMKWIYAEQQARHKELKKHIAKNKQAIQKLKQKLIGMK